MAYDQNNGPTTGQWAPQSLDDIWQKYPDIRSFVEQNRQGFTNAGYGTDSSLMDALRLNGHDLNNLKSLIGWQEPTTVNDAPPAPPPGPGPTPPPTGGPGGGPITDPFPGTFTPPNPVDLGGPAGIPFVPPTPQFHPPSYTPPPAFKPPTIDDLMKAPGFQWRVGQGEDSLQRWAAAKGTLNDSGTAKALIDYGQGAASQEYQNEYNREYGTYQTNYQTQYADPYMHNWDSAVQQNANDVLGYSTQAQAGQRQTENNYANAWQAFLQNWNIFRDQRDSTWDKTFQYANT